MRTHILLLTFAFFLFSCERKNYIEEEFESPSIEIVSTKVLSSSECEIEVKVELGKGALIREAFVSFWDITTESAVADTHSIELTDQQEQTHTLTVNMLADKHDYRVRAILKSAKNEYFSQPQIVRFSEQIGSDKIKYVELYLEPSRYDYIDENQKIGKYLLKGGSFLFIVYYHRVPDKETPVEIKLNGTIPITNDLDFSFGWSLENSRVSGGAYLPNDIEVGIYTVHVYIDGIEYILDYKIEVLPTRYEIVNIQNMPYEMNWLSDPVISFLSGSKIHYLHNEYNPFKMLIYDLETKGWNEKNEFPYKASPLPVKVTSGTQNYLLFNVYKKEEPHGWVEVESLSLFVYDQTGEEWHRITDYPGQGTRGVIAFAVDNKIYIGGGVRETYESGYFERIENLQDFWEYDIVEEKWTSKKNLPYETHWSGFINSSCGNTTNGYVFSQYRDLYKYTPQTDAWEIMTPLKGGPFHRMDSKLLYHKDKLYIVGGQSIGDAYNPRDVWEYDIKTNRWILINLFDVNLRHPDVQTFIYKDKILLGYSALLYGSEPIYVEIDLP